MRRGEKGAREPGRLPRGWKTTLGFGGTLFVIGVGCAAQEPSDRVAEGSVEIQSSGGEAPGYRGPISALPRRTPLEGESPETEEDWGLAEATVAWALEQRLGQLPLGEVAAIVGETFVGSPYVPGTLELPGEERLVVNLSGFDCVTFVEHMLVLARLVVDPVPGFSGPTSPPAAREDFRERYRALLRELRYREGRIAGYASRLHYFTEWMDAGVERGQFLEVTEALGGVPDARPIHFMSSNPASYRPLREDPALVPAIRETEARLTARRRLHVPKDRIEQVEGGIRNGDVIAAVSTVDGLDISHTGLAVWKDGRLHLMHAPLVGDSVEVSALPLADRIQGIRAQSGIRVIRALDR